MSVLTIPPSWRDRAVVVDAIDGDLAAWFSGDELATAAAFKLPKRRDEWLLSRYAAKRLALARGLPHDVAIARPRLASGEWISISHSRGVAAAAIDDAPVGIDVERVRRVAEHITRHFLTDDERAALERCSIANRVLHWWCAKEAVWKQHGGDVKLLRDVPLTLERESDAGLLFQSAETFAAGDVLVALTRSTS